MRFEHILHIYWTKGFFFGGKLFYFNKSLPVVFSLIPGLNRKFRYLLNQRFEWLTIFDQKFTLLDDFQKISRIPVLPAFNIIFSQINNVNADINDLHKFNIIRLYLIKSYRGRCHAIGKPVRGQRTWSNAWNSYNTNKVLRFFITKTRDQLKTQEVQKKINYKLIQKKTKTKRRRKKEVKVKKKIWF